MDVLGKFTFGLLCVTALSWLAGGTLLYYALHTDLGIFKWTSISWQDAVGAFILIRIIVGWFGMWNGLMFTGLHEIIKELPYKTRDLVRKDENEMIEILERIIKKEIGDAVQKTNTQ